MKALYYLQIVGNCVLAIFGIALTVWAILVIWDRLFDRFLRICRIQGYFAEFVWNGEISRLRKARREEVLRKAAK